MLGVLFRDPRRALLTQSSTLSSILSTVGEFSHIRIVSLKGLVYFQVTPRIVIMGYPAAGFEALYRNKREDAKRWLDTKHGKNYWVFNFCPIRENSYEGSVFEGRVTRFPFPDHQCVLWFVLSCVGVDGRMWMQCSTAGYFAACSKGSERLVG